MPVLLLCLHKLLSLFCWEVFLWTRGCPARVRPPRDVALQNSSPCARGVASHQQPDAFLHSSVITI